jgi:hypothetical protein
MSGTTTQPEGRDWLAMSPAHFNRDLLPPRARREAAQPGLFSAADVTPSTTRQPRKQDPEMTGQMDLFGPDPA